MKIYYICTSSVISQKSFRKYEFEYRQKKTKTVAAFGIFGLSWNNGWVCKIEEIQVEDPSIEFNLSIRNSMQEV